MRIVSIQMERNEPVATDLRYFHTSPELADHSREVSVGKEEKSIQIEQLAHIVIDAYLRRQDAFTPVFEDGAEGFMYLERPDAENDHPELKVRVWYNRSDYEPDKLS